jgi:hypothetical protein
MAKRKAATSDAIPGAGEPVRPANPGEAGGGDDAATGAQLAVKLLIRDLKAIQAKYTSPMDPELGNMVALYARTLSAIQRDQRKGGRGEFGDKSLEELAEMAKGIPELRELLGRDAD